MGSGIMDMIGKVLGGECKADNVEQVDDTTKDAIHKELVEKHQNSDFAHMAMSEALPFLKKEIGEIAGKFGVSAEGAVGAICSKLGLGG